MSQESFTWKDNTFEATAGMSDPDTGKGAQTTDIRVTGAVTVSTTGIRLGYLRYTFDMKYENYDHKNLTWKRKQAMDSRMFPHEKCWRQQHVVCFDMRVWTLKITLPVMPTRNTLFLLSPRRRSWHRTGVISPRRHLPGFEIAFDTVKIS